MDAGQRSIQFPPNVGVQLKAGTKLVGCRFIITPRPPLVPDQIGLEMHFNDAPPEYRVMLAGIGNFNVLIPAETASSRGRTTPARPSSSFPPASSATRRR